MSREKNRVEELVPVGLAEIAEPFIEFLKKYYEFTELGEYSPSAVINRDQIVRNFQTTSETFLQKIYTEVGASYYLNKDNLDDDVANLLKNLRILYEAKGSLESIKILFRILFQEDVEIYLPKELLLIPSSGNWDQEYAFMATLVSGDPFDIVGEFVTIQTQFPNQTAQTITVEVTRVETTEVANLYEVFITQYDIQVLYYGATLTYNDVTMTLQPITELELRKKDVGTGFSFSQSYPVTNYTRNTFGSWVTPQSITVPAGSAADSGDTQLDLSSGAGLAVGDYIFGDSALSLNTTIASFVDSDTITISSPLIAPMNTSQDVDLFTSRYPDSFNDILKPYFIDYTSTRRFTSADPTKVFDTESVTRTGRTDGLLIETLTRSDEQITNLYYDQEKITVTTEANSNREFTTVTDSSVYPAPNILTNWDEVINELTKVAHGESDGYLYNFFTTTNSFTLLVDSAQDSATTIQVQGSVGNLQIGDYIEGTGIDSDTYVTSIDSATVFSINKTHLGLADSATLTINNYQRGDINRDGVIDVLDVELLVRRLMQYPISGASLNWIQGVIEDDLDSDVNTPSAASFNIVTNRETLSGSTQLNLDNTAGLQAGFGISGTGIQGNTSITAINDVQTVTIDKATTAIIQGDSAPVTLAIDTTLGSRAAVRPNQLGDSDSLTSFYFQKFGYNYPVYFVGVMMPDSGDIASSVFLSSPTVETRASYSDNLGFLSDDIKLQDGDLYQNFSYVIKSDIQLSEVEDILYKTVHPAGMKAFGELVAGQNITITSDVSLVVDSRLNRLLQDQFTVVDSDYKSLTLRVDLSGFGGDSAEPVDSIPVKTIDRGITSGYFAENYFENNAYFIDDAVIIQDASIDIRLNGIPVG